MKTYIPKQNEIDRKWWVVDADGQNLGRMATRIAMILRGKHKPSMSPTWTPGTSLSSLTPTRLPLPALRKRRRCITATPATPVESINGLSGS